MSTRSAIMRAEEGGGRGVYHHFDGYPTALGLTLLRLRDAQFDGDHRAMTKFLIDDHPAGWSTINSRDWSQRPGFVNTMDAERTCHSCGLEVWRHYRQYYQGHGVAEPEGSETMVLGHQPNSRLPLDDRPQCYCHGDRAEDGNELVCVDDPATEGWCQPEAGVCDPLFIEWAYRIHAGGIEVWESKTKGSGNGEFGHHKVGDVAWGDEAAMLRIAEIAYGGAFA